MLHQPQIHILSDTARVSHVEQDMHRDPQPREAPLQFALSICTFEAMRKYLNKLQCSLYRLTEMIAGIVLVLRTALKHGNYPRHKVLHLSNRHETRKVYKSGRTIISVGQVTVSDGARWEPANRKLSRCHQVIRVTSDL